MALLILKKKRTQGHRYVYASLTRMQCSSVAVDGVTGLFHLPLRLPGSRLFQVSLNNMELRYIASLRSLGLTVPEMTPASRRKPNMQGSGKVSPWKKAILRLGVEEGDICSGKHHDQLRSELMLHVFTNIIHHHMSCRSTGLCDEVGDIATNGWRGGELINSRVVAKIFPNLG